MKNAVAVAASIVIIVAGLVGSTLVWWQLGILWGFLASVGLATVWLFSAVALYAADDRAPGHHWVWCLAVGSTAAECSWFMIGLAIAVWTHYH